MKKWILLALIPLLTSCGLFNRNQTKTITQEKDLSYVLFLKQGWLEDEYEIRTNARDIADAYCTEKDMVMYPLEATSKRGTEKDPGASTYYHFTCQAGQKDPSPSLFHRLGFFKDEESKKATLEEQKNDIEKAKGK